MVEGKKHQSERCLAPGPTPKAPSCTTLANGSRFRHYLLVCLLSAIPLVPLNVLPSPLPVFSEDLALRPQSISPEVAHDPK